MALASYTYTSRGQVETVTYPDGGVRSYHYENTNFPKSLTGITAESGVRFSTFAYDAKGRVISSQHAGGADAVTLAYTAQGGAVVTNALGLQTNYGLTTAGTLARPRKISTVTDSAGTVTSTYYDITEDFRNRLSTVTDRNGTLTKHEYSEALDPISNTTASIHSIKEAVGSLFERIIEERRQTATNRLLTSKIGGQETRYTRNARLQPLTMTTKDMTTGVSRATTITYCESADVAAANSTCPILGFVKSIDGPRTDVNDITTYTYRASDDASCATAPTTCPHRKGDLWKVTNALGQVTEMLKYDSVGRVLSMKDATGVVNDLEYHSRGWLTARKTRGTNATVETDDQIARIEYWPTGLIKQVTQPDGDLTAYTYDAAHRLTDIADNAGNTIRYTLDNAGNRLAEDAEDPQGALKRTLSRVYNQLGQLQTQADASANPTDLTHDANGNLNTVTDALGRVTDNDYDPLNRLSRTLQDVGGINAETKFAYDALDNLTQVTDPKGLNTVYTYNGLSDLTQLQSPDTGTTAYTYDSAGNRATQTDARGVTTSYAYDALNRLTAVTYADTSLNVAYVYDVAQPVCTVDEAFPVGRLTAMTDGSGSTQYCYDRFGHLTRKVQTSNGQSFALRYAYTKASQLQSVTYPDGAVADYVRDAQGRTIEVGLTRSGGTREVLLNQASYAPFGPVTGWTYGNGRSLQRALDQDYRPVAVEDSAPGGLSLGFGYDAVGNLTQLTPANDPAPIINFGYDALSRLTQTKDGPTQIAIETYAYDKTGNRQSLTNAGGTTTFTYPVNNHRLATVGALVRTYDAAGNTTAIGGAAKEFVYNATGRMSQVKQAGVTTMNYAYNGKGEQVRKTLGAANTYTLFDEAGHWLGDYNSSSSPIQQAIWLDDMPVGLIANNQLHYLEPDHLGTPRVVIEPTRNVPVWKWDLKGEAFGNSPPDQDPDGDTVAFVLDMRYPGQRYDAASGLNYNYFRDGYDSSAGRYSQSDPIGLKGGPSTYAYVGGNPVNAIDPLGLLTLIFVQNDNRLIAIKDGNSYNVNATSGRADCPGCTSMDRNKGPIPNGDYRIYARDLSNPRLIGDLLRNTKGDWGDWRVKLWPDDEKQTFGRNGFYLHGGSLPGSAGCIDVGGGINGSEVTNKLLNDIISDPDGMIHVRVR